MLHRISQIDVEQHRGDCANCGPVRIESKGRNSWVCGKAARASQEARRKPWTLAKKDYCEALNCTTTIVDSCQLDVDHIDGDKKNNDLSNLMTLCACCHRLKTKVNRDWVGVRAPV